MAEQRNIFERESELKTKCKDLEFETHRQKIAIDGVAKEYVCPITMCLPIDPVIAEDGRIYERAAIQKRIEETKTRCSATEEYTVKSPMMNVTMGVKLIPAVQVKNTIHSLIEGGVVEEDAAESWKAAVELMQKAKLGDIEAIIALAKKYHTGTGGFTEDRKKSYYWISKAAELGSPGGMFLKGLSLMYGFGVERKLHDSLICFGAAAGMGDAKACVTLGKIYFGCDESMRELVPINHALAKYWIQKGLAEKEDLFESFVKCAEDMLKEIEEGLSSSSSSSSPS